MKHLTQRREEYPSTMVCLAVMAHGDEVARARLVETRGVPQDLKLESIHLSTGQLVLSTVVKNTS